MLSGCVLVTTAAAADATATRRADRTGLARVFLDGVNAYEKGQFQRAADSFSRIAAAGVRNGTLFYDLGNAYLKSGDLGRAILWYERAALLIPGDADLRFNLEYARSLTRDDTAANGVDLGRILFFWNDALGERSVRLLAIGFNAAFWACVAAAIATRRRVLRRPAFALGILALVFALTAAFNYYRDTRPGDGIILPPEVSVRSGLEEGSTELFRLHAGAKVRIDRTQGDHVRISFAKDRIGWVPEKDVGAIRLGG